jgi:hypothetical protein
MVGGNARNVGKTTLVTQIIAASRQREWIGVKISGHPHGQSSLPVFTAKPRATEQFLAAGAAEAYLLRENEADRARLDGLVASGRNVIIESNRAVEWVAFDDYVFVLDLLALNPKPRERWHLERADWILPPRRDAPIALLARYK